MSVYCLLCRFECMYQYRMMRWYSFFPEVQKKILLCNPRTFNMMKYATDTQVHELNKSSREVVSGYEKFWIQTWMARKEWKKVHVPHWLLLNSRWLCSRIFWLTSIPTCSKNTNTLCGSIDGVVRSGSDEGRIGYLVLGSVEGIVDNWNYVELNDGILEEV